VIPWRQAVGAVGLLASAAAVAAGQTALVWGAIAILAVSLGLRLVAAICKRRAASRPDSVPAGEDG
jgi:hypothetical protein